MFYQKEKVYEEKYIISNLVKVILYLQSMNCLNLNDHCMSSGVGGSVDWVIYIMYTLIIDLSILLFSKFANKLFKYKFNLPNKYFDI